ncbi:MAG: Gfo/Idh/MocA family oxidoreductase [Clostridiales Family XIII bacterium]|jgi:predicted dehydrogenase|nr:Gfo/Idh/MocA family oxidoreductase [Clostridiales Family XIII bacterium]
MIKGVNQRFLNIGVICPSEIAFRRFMPALEKAQAFRYAGIGASSFAERFGDVAPDAGKKAAIAEETRKAQAFSGKYGGEIFESYEAIAASGRIDALYIPLPPALHCKWAMRALEAGKHVLVEKPATLSAKDTAALTALAGRAGLAVHENYMFVFHKQIGEVARIVSSGEIGEVRLYRIDFGFPRRAEGDFRYSKALGGGALFDCGGYTLRYAMLLLGGSARLVCANAGYEEGLEVDVSGTATLVNDAGRTAQIAFGMDNDYRCSLDVWGSKGSLHTGRILTAPAGFEPEIRIVKNGKEEIRALSEDDAFENSINRFAERIRDPGARAEGYESAESQARAVDEFARLAGMRGF